MDSRGASKYYLISFHSIAELNLCTFQAPAQFSFFANSFVKKKFYFAKGRNRVFVGFGTYMYMFMSMKRFNCPCSCAALCNY